MFGEGGLKPPVKFYPLVPPPLVSGVQVTGNDKEVVTERGKTFLLTVINLLHSSVKLFGDSEKISWDKSAWPGLELKAPQDRWGFISYVGESEEKKVDWGDFLRTDFDFDGETDSKTKIDSPLPISLFKKETGVASVTDYTALWTEVRGKLSPAKSFQQTIIDKSYPLTDEGKFALLVGLVETKRRWIYGSRGIGIDPRSATDAGFKTIFDDSWKIKEAGALNIQVLQNYLNLRIELAKRFNAIAVGDWVKDSGLEKTIQDYLKLKFKDLLTLANKKAEEFSAAIVGLKAMLTPAGKLANEEDVPAAASLLSNIEWRLSDFSKICQGIMDKIGLVSSKTMEAKKVFDTLNSEYKTIKPTSVSAGTDFSLVISKLNLLVSAGANLKAALEDNLKSATADPLFNEFKQLLSEEKFTDDFQKEITKRFSAALGKPIGYVAGIQGTNGTFRSMNKTNQSRYEAKKEEQRLEKMEEMRAQGKHRARMKEIEKKPSPKITSSVQASKEAEKAQAKKNNNKKVR
jgi:hypothetical protein